MAKNIRVAIRVRPQLETEVVDVCVDCPSETTISVATHNDVQCFSFDYVAGQTVSQEEMFQRIGVTLVDTTLEGYNATLFVYGQTGSGKTFTTFGDYTNPQNYGLVPRCISYLFTKLVDPTVTRTFDVTLSLCEIYNENILDLLQKDKKERKPLNIREDPRLGTYVFGITQKPITTLAEALKEISFGLTHRHVGSTNVNEYSSRSHCIFTIILNPKPQDGVAVAPPSKLTFVDLAGSERQTKTGAVGTTLKEANNINRSLVTLGSVIRGLIARSSGKNEHIPYRDSKLTFLLRDSLGGNCRTWIVGTVSPSLSNNWETFSTIRFCHGSKMVKCQAKKNDVVYNSLDEMQKEIDRLKKENERLREHGAGRSICSVDEKELEKTKSRVRHLEYIVFAKMDQENGFRQDIKLMTDEIERYKLEVEQLKRANKEMGAIFEAMSIQNAELRKTGPSQVGDQAVLRELERWKALYLDHPEVKTLRAENQLLRDKLNAMKSGDEQVEDLKRVNQDLSNEIASLSRSVRLTSAENERLEAENRSLKANATESVVNEYRRKMNELDRHIVELQVGMRDRERRIEELQADNEQLVQMYDEQKQRLERYSRKSVRELKEDVLGGARMEEDDQPH